MMVHSKLRKTEQQSKRSPTSTQAVNIIGMTMTGGHSPEEEALTRIETEV